jgi:hypothetical protein
MNNSDKIGFIFTLSFGFWWLIAPRSVVIFYTWFHRQGVRVPKPVGIRVIGLAWIVLVACVMIFSRRG